MTVNDVTPFVSGKKSKPHDILPKNNSLLNLSMCKWPVNQCEVLSLVIFTNSLIKPLNGGLLYIEVMYLLRTEMDLNEGDTMASPIIHLQ